MKEICPYECGLYLSIILASAFQLVFTEDRCRTLEFKGTDIYPHSAFTANIIQTRYVQSEDQCKIACWAEDSCKSYNLGPPQGGDGKQVCELSSSLHTFHPSHLVPRPGFIYRPSASLCDPPCADNQTCHPDNGGHSCFCIDPGFTGDACAEDIDECAANTHDCGADAICTNNEGSFTCSCPDGFEGDGKTCQEVDECSRGTHNCDVTATCVNTVGSFTCSCPSDLVLGAGNKCVGFPFHWILDGTNSDVNLHGAATFVDQNGRKVLYLDGTPNTYAETPAVAIRQTDFTIAVWIKVVSPFTMRQMIYCDWSTPHQFWFFVTDTRQVQFLGRRDSVKEPVMSITTDSSDTVQLDVWSHVAVTWRRTDRKAKLYINGDMKIELVAADNPDLDLKNSGHTVYEIGLKRDNGETSHAYYSDLWVFNRTLSDNEIFNDLFNSHPFRTFT